MKTRTSAALAGASLALLLALGLGAMQARQTQENRQQPDPERVIADWPATPQKVALEMIQKYGQPDGITSSRLIWQDKEPWSEIIINREEVPHSFPMEHTDVLEQVVGYRVPPDKFDELAAYDGSVIVERTKGTMSARCDKEAANYLALNLAHDIVTGNKTVEEARQFYADTIQAMMSGEKPEYTQKLLFEPQPNAGDPDKAVIQKR